MFELRVESTFSSAHNLRGYKGKCEELHGHNWKVEVTIAKEELDNIGLVIDFKDIKNSLNNVLKDLDHKHLNELDYFKKNNPTSENIAKYIFDRLKSQIDVAIKKVTVWESDAASASYSEK